MIGKLALIVLFFAIASSPFWGAWLATIRYERKHR